MYFRLLATILLSLVLLVVSCSALAPTSQDFSANSKYSYVGKSIIDVSSSLISTNTSNWASNPLAVTINFPQSLINTSVHAGLVLQDFTANNVGQGLSANLILSSIKQSSILANIFTKNASNIAKLAIGYFLIVADDSYKTNFLIVSFQKLFLAGKNITNDSSSYCNQQVALSTPFNSANATIVGFLSGIYATPADNSLIIDINSIANFVNNTMIAVQISSASSTPTTINQIQYIFILYNQEGLSLSPKNLFFFQSGGFSSGKNITLQHNITSVNMLIGLYSFALSNSQRFGFNMTVGYNATNIRYSGNFTRIAFSYFVFYSLYCSYNTPYLYSSLQLCYDVCPAGTASNAQLLQCSLSPQISSESNPPIGLIVGVVIGGLVLVSIGILILLKCKKIACFKEKIENDQTNNSNQFIAQSANRINKQDEHIVTRPAQQSNTPKQDPNGQILQPSNQSEKVTIAQAKTLATPYKQAQKDIIEEIEPIPESNEGIRIDRPQKIQMNFENMADNIYALHGHDNLWIVEDHQLQFAGNQYLFYN